MALESTTCGKYNVNKLISYNMIGGAGFHQFISTKHPCIKKCLNSGSATRVQPLHLIVLLLINIIYFLAWKNIEGVILKATVKRLLQFVLADAKLLLFGKIFYIFQFSFIN